MTIPNVIAQLKQLERYDHRICDEGDGYIDDWPSESDNGQYVLWSDIEKLIELLKNAND